MLGSPKLKLFSLCLMGALAAVVVLKETRQTSKAPFLSNKIQNAMAKESNEEQKLPCVNQLRNIVEAKRGQNLAVVVDALSWANRVAIGFDNVNGRNRVERVPSSKLSSSMEKFLTGQDWEKIKKILMNDDHKVLKLDHKVMMVYKDNVCVAADADSCEIEGIFMPSQSNQIHPAIEAALKSPRVTEDTCKKACNCELKNGGVCNVHQQDSNQACHNRCASVQNFAKIVNWGRCCDGCPACQ